MNAIIIVGKEIPLRPLDRSELKGIYIDALVGYSFYEAAFQDNFFWLLAPKKERKLSPLQYKHIADRIGEVKQIPCAFLFDSLATYERDRLIDKGVFFVVSNKYVFLPFLLINAKSGEEIKKDKLIPSAQFLILYHLQVTSLNGYSLQELEKRLPIKYVTLSRGVKQLEALRLVKCTINEEGFKELSFHDDNPVLWQKAFPLMQSPIKSLWYAMGMPPSEAALSGINALSNYSSLNPEEMSSYALYDETFRNLKNNGSLTGLNKMEGDIRLEVWKYPPIDTNRKGKIKLIDRLSLYLLLKDDPDPRVEKELEILINSIW